MIIPNLQGMYLLVIITCTKYNYFEEVSWKISSILVYFLNDKSIYFFKNILKTSPNFGEMSSASFLNFILTNGIEPKIQSLKFRWWPDHHRWRKDIRSGAISSATSDVLTLLDFQKSQAKINFIFLNSLCLLFNIHPRYMQVLNSSQNRDLGICSIFYFP